jgi:hypothetical protein
LGAPAHATLILSLSDGTTSISVTDGSALDSNAAAGVITYSGAVGSNWWLNVSTAIGTGAYQGGFGIDLNSVNLSFGTGTLKLAMTETGLNWGPLGATEAQVVGKIGGVTAGSVSYSLYTDNTNASFGKQNMVFAGTGSSAFSETGGGAITLLDPFSMSLFLDINHPAGGNTSFNFEGKVPEPASLALLGLGLLGMGFARRRNTA